MRNGIFKSCSFLIITFLSFISLLMVQFSLAIRGCYIPSGWNMSHKHRFLNTLDATFRTNLGENRKFLSMLWYEQELSKYLVSKFVLKYNIKPWGVFHPVCCWSMLLWVVSGVFRNWCSQATVVSVFWTRKYQVRK